MKTSEITNKILTNSALTPVFFRISLNSKGRVFKDMRISRLAKNKFLKDVSQNTFTVMLVLFLLSLLIENIFPNSISNYINLNYLLVITIIFGVLAVLTGSENVKTSPKSSKYDIFYATGAGIITFVILFYKITQPDLQIIVSIIGGILVFLLSILILEGENKV